MKLIYQITIVAFFCLIISCSRKSETQIILDHAEAMMEEYPDSALSIIQSIDVSTLKGDREKACHALLLSQALDKNYVDTTDFNVLQPAIDYYLENGSTNERFKTLYYQARIFQNMGDEEKAMHLFLKALDLRDQLTDTLALARALGAQSVIYYKEYKLKEFINNNLEAAKLYHKIHKPNLELRSALNALDGSIMIGDRIAADSLMKICIKLNKNENNDEDFISSSILSYLNEFGTKDEIKSFLRKDHSAYLFQDDMLNIAYGYSKIGEIDKALNIIEDIEVGPTLFDSLKYYAIMINLLQDREDYKRANNMYNRYSIMLGDYHNSLFAKDLLFAEKKHQLEVNNLRSIYSRNRIIIIIASIFVTLLLFTSVLYYRFRLSKTKHILLEKDIEKTELERDKKILEAENLRLELYQLEIERDNLMDLIKKGQIVEKDLLEIIKIRIAMLNSILARDITNNDKHALPYNNWLNSIRKEKYEFMKSTRLLFTAIYPNFIDYLNEHNLTEDEINCVCLYAIGLKGKEIGEFTQQKRHYAMSSEIRKKLNMKTTDTNISIFIKTKLRDIEGTDCLMF